MTIIAYVLTKRVVDEQGCEHTLYLDKHFKHTTIVSQARPFDKMEAQRYCEQVFDGMGWHCEVRELKRFAREY